MKLHSETYDSYKNAEGEWSETIPSEWQEKRVKDLFRLVTDAAPADNDYELLSLYAGIGVKPRKDLEARGNKASSTDGYWIVRKNDIVVNKLLAWMGSVGLSEYDGVTSPAYDVLRQVSKDIDPRYFAYLFRTEIAKKIFRKNSRGIMDMRLRLYFDKLGALTVPVPSFEEQISIAKYINEKVAIIDKKISLIKRKLDLVKKRHHALVKNTVRKGTKKHPSTKWRGLRVGDFSKVINGYAFNSKQFSLTKGHPLVRIRDLNQTTTNTLYDGPFVKAAAISAKDLLIGMDGDFNVGRWLGEGEALLNQRVCCVRSKTALQNRFLEYALPEPLALINQYTNATTVKHLSSSQVEKVFIYLPNDDIALEETLAYLDNSRDITNKEIENLCSQLDKLNNLKVAIIYDAIIGRIKIPSEGNGQGVTA